MINEKKKYGTGRRKRAIARVFLTQDSKILVNNQPLNSYFKNEKSCFLVGQPLKLLKITELGLFATVKGGGSTAQSEAIRHGLAKALVNYDESYKVTLRKAGFLTRDARQVERKKVGFRKSRRRPQFSKR